MSVDGVIEVHGLGRRYASYSRGSSDGGVHARAGLGINASGVGST